MILSKVGGGLSRVPPLIWYSGYLPSTLKGPWGPRPNMAQATYEEKKKKVAILDLEPDHLDGVPAFSSGNTITGVSTATQSFIPDRSVKEPFYFVFSIQVLIPHAG